MSGLASNQKTHLPNPAAISDAQSILRYQSSIEDLYLHLARERLTPDKNSGKQRFYGVVTKVLDNTQVLSDMFIYPNREIERLEGSTESEKDSYKIAFLHVPELFTYYNQLEIDASKQNRLTSSDLQKIPALTTKNLKVGNIVQVTFENTETYTGPLILSVDNGKTKRLPEERKRFKSAKQVLNDIIACKLLTADDAQGYAAASTTLLNSKNPKLSYSQVVTQLLDSLQSDNLIKRIVLSNTTAELESKYSTIADSNFTSTEQAVKTFKENSSTIPFSYEISVSQEVKDYITDVLGLVNAPLKLQTFDKRKIYLNFEPLTTSSAIKNSLVSDVSEYVGSLVRSYNYGYLPETGNTFSVDIFGSPNISESIKGGDVTTAIKYSKVLDNRSIESINETKTQVSRGLSATPDATSSKPVTDGQTTTTVKENIPNCEDQSEVNNLIYTSVKSKTNLSSFKKDMTRMKEISDNAQIGDWYSNIEKYINYDFKNSANISDVKDAKGNLLFSFSLPSETIATQPESSKIPKNGSQSSTPSNTTNVPNKPKTPKPIGTNQSQIEKNGKFLAEFVKKLTNLIAENERIDRNRVFVFPLSVFRKYDRRSLRRNSGIDRNSRHFFNRAIDFTVYINIDDDFDPSEKTIPTEGTFEIPNAIVYAYVLKLFSIEPFFKVCGLGLLERGSKRTTGYVHYEYMNKVPNTDENRKNVRRNRRWVSESTNKNSVYSKAFGQPNQSKDSIILNFILRDVKSKIGILPEKIENLL